MAKDRMIKAEFWEDKKLSKLHRDARFLFIGLWSISDDHGVCNGYLDFIKGRLFQSDKDMGTVEIASHLNSLAKAGMILIFTNNDDEYIFIKNFGKHQTLKHQSKRKHPEPPNETETLFFDESGEISPNYSEFPQSSPQINLNKNKLDKITTNQVKLNQDGSPKIYPIPEETQVISCRLEDDSVLEEPELTMGEKVDFAVDAINESSVSIEEPEHVSESTFENWTLENDPTLELPALDFDTALEVMNSRAELFKLDEVKDTPELTDEEQEALLRSKMVGNEHKRRPKVESDVASIGDIVKQFGEDLSSRKPSKDELDKSLSAIGEAGKGVIRKIGFHSKPPKAPPPQLDVSVLKSYDKMQLFDQIREHFHDSHSKKQDIKFQSQLAQTLYKENDLSKFSNLVETLNSGGVKNKVGYCCKSLENIRKGVYR